MPALPAVPKVIRVDMLQAIGNDPRGKDRFYLQYTGAGGVIADLTTLGNTISASWNTNLAPLYTSFSSLSSLLLTDLTSASSPQVTNGTAHAGTRAGTQLSNAVCAIVRCKIARRYRGGHPRHYLAAGVSGDLAQSNAWTVAFQSALTTGWTNFISGAIAAPPASLTGLAEVNVSYFSGFTNKVFPSGRTRPVPTLRVSPVVDSVVSYSVNPIIGSQRRRNLQSA